MLVDSYEIAGTIDRTNFIRNDKVHLIKLECYKQTKHLLGMEEYKPLKMWW